MLIDQSLAAFAAATAARAPTPGGGSVAAYLAALGSALGAMAARYTEGRKGFEAHTVSLSSEIARLDALRADFERLVDEDARVYEQVTAAYALPKSSADEQARRQAAVQAALVAALDVPLRVARATVAGLELLLSLGTHVNPQLASDVAVGAYALAAGCRGAWINVLINLKGLRDEERRRAVLDEGRALLAQVGSLEARVAGPIVAGLGG